VDARLLTERAQESTQASAKPAAGRAQGAHLIEADALAGLPGQATK